MKPLNKVSTDDAANLLASLQQAALEGAQQAKDSAEEESQEDFTYTGNMPVKMEQPSKENEGKICYPSEDNDGWLQRRKEALEFAILQNAGAYSAQMVNDFEQSLSAYEGGAEERLAKRERQAPNYGGELPSKGVDEHND